MEEGSKDVIKRHAIMVAIPYQGHINPFIHLALKLASKGFTITFVNTQFAHYQLTNSHHNNSDIFSDARKSGLDIRYATITDGFPLEYDRNANLVEFWDYNLRNFPSHVDEFVANLIKESSFDPAFVPILVVDTFASWPALMSKKHKLLSVSFWTQPAMTFAINYYTNLLRENDHFPLSGDRNFSINYIPGVEPIHTKDLMSFLQDSEATIIHKIVFSAFEEVKKADFVLHNTVQELESNTLSTLSEQSATYAIGPINFFYHDAKSSISKSFLFEVDCSEWLNSKSPGSVLYVSFGSLVPIKEQAIEEVAKGLQLSQVNFLWAIRPESVGDEKNAVPIGFAEDIKDRGLIVPWCNQTDVLSHPAIGGFVTHCGWNSTLEAMWYGVPMICYPILYDQPSNRKLVVDDWKIGINLCDGDTVDREEVTIKIKTLMSDETSFDDVRSRMKRHNSIMRNALAKDGSSDKNFDRFIRDLKEKIAQRHQNM